jgi:hypothetical protein
VYVDSNATFTMAGGDITENTASAANSSYGGGVYVDNTGLFAMDNGTLGGNTAQTGGGVYVNSTGLFTKAAALGCIIYGSDGGTNKNTATGGDAGGHAVYAGSAKKRNSTAGTLVELDSTSSGSAGGWE